MILEQFEIFIRKHYYISLDLLEKMKQGVERASAEDGRREAEDRYQKFLSLHRVVEMKYQKYWGPSGPGVAVTEREIPDTP